MKQTGIREWPIALYFLVFTVQITIGIDNNYSRKWRWLVVKFAEAAKRRGKYPLLSTNTEVYEISEEMFYPN